MEARLRRAGRLHEVTNPRGMRTATADDGTTLYDYDTLDRLVLRSQREHENGALKNTLRTHYCYDLPGDLRAVVPPKANVTSVDCASLGTLPRAARYDYDDAHRLTTDTDALGHTRRTSYDENGDVRSTTDEAGSETVLTRDQRGLVTKAVEPFDGASGRSLTTLLGYDAAGNLEREVTPRGWDASADKVTFASFVKEFRYDRLNRLAKELLPTGAGTTTPLFVHHGYDGVGNETLTTLPDPTDDPANVPADKKTLPTYFDPGWVESIAERAKPTVRFEYTAEGWQRLRIPDKPGGGPNTFRQREWKYFADGMLKEEHVATDGSNSATNTFEYDANNNLVKAHNTTGLNATTKQKPMLVMADYDLLDRPFKVRSQRDQEPNWNVTTMGYDLNGNLTSRTDDRDEDGSGAVVNGKAGRDQTFSYDEADWLREQIDRGPTSSGSDDRRVTSSFHPTGWAKERVIEHSDATGSYARKQRTSWEYFLNGKLPSSRRRTAPTRSRSSTTSRMSTRPACTPTVIARRTSSSSTVRIRARRVAARRARRRMSTTRVSG